MGTTLLFPNAAQRATLQPYLQEKNERGERHQPFTTAFYELVSSYKWFVSENSHPNCDLMRRFCGCPFHRSVWWVYALVWFWLVGFSNCKIRMQQSDVKGKRFISKTLIIYLLMREEKKLFISSACSMSR